MQRISRLKEEGNLEKTSIISLQHTTSTSGSTWPYRYSLVENWECDPEAGDVEKCGPKNCHQELNQSLWDINLKK